MTTCPECGHTGGPAAQFCTHCGAAVPQRQIPSTHIQPTQAAPSRPAPSTGGGSRRGLVGLVVAGGATVGVIATFALVTGIASESTNGQAAGPPNGIITYQATETPVTPQWTSEAVPLPDSPYPTELEPDDGAAALEELQRLQAEDRSEAEALVGQWVPQLSAKRPGLVANGITYDYVEILRDFHDTQARYPDALLLSSSDYTSFRYGDFWITVVPRPHLDGPTTNTWCDAEGIPLEDCYAKMISHTIGYVDATEVRG